MNRSVLYLQYTSPANYPPLEHSSRILADAGWQVLPLARERMERKPSEDSEKLWPMVVGHTDEICGTGGGENISEETELQTEFALAQ